MEYPRRFLILIFNWERFTESRLIMKSSVKWIQSISFPRKLPPNRRKILWLGGHNKLAFSGKKFILYILWRKKIQIIKYFRGKNWKGVAELYVFTHTVKKKWIEYFSEKSEWLLLHLKKVVSTDNKDVL
jgi:hypothetical protein